MADFASSRAVNVSQFKTSHQALSPMLSWVIEVDFWHLFCSLSFFSLGGARAWVVVHGTGGEVKYTLEQLLTAVKAFLQSAPASSAFPHLPCCCWHPCCCCCCSLNINPPQILMLSKLYWEQHGSIKAVVGFAQNANSLLIWVECQQFFAHVTCDAIMKHPENMPRGVVGFLSVLTLLLQAGLSYFDFLSFHLSACICVFVPGFEFIHT